MSSILYNDSYCIGVDELNKIYLSLLTSADYIYINQNVDVDWQLPPSIYQHIKNSLESLHKHGLIKYWSFPYVLGDKTPDVVLDKHEYFLWDNIINETFFNAQSLHSIFNYFSQGNHLFSQKEENTSKILLIRREYWTYALLTMLHADKVLNFFSDWMPENNQATTVTTERLDDIAIRNIFACSSSSVFALEATDIIALHKKNKKLRNQLNQKTANLSTIKNTMIDDLLHEAIEANSELIKQEKWSNIDNSVNLLVTLTGIAVNQTPAGFIFNQIQTAKDLGQGVYNAIGALCGKDDTRNLFYILIKMRNRMNNKLKKADSGLFRQSL